MEPTARRLWRLPTLERLRAYTWQDLPSDLMAGLVVTLVLIPSAIAYSDLAKCPPGAGLYAALGGMVAFALLTSSRHVVTGPDAAIALMVGGAVGAVTNGDPSHAVAIATWLALLTGALLLLAAWLRLGAAADFLANPVMLGFMNGAAVVIIVSQLGKLFGLKLHQDNSLLKIYEWLTHLTSTHWPTLALGLGFIALLIALRTWVPKVPGAIVVFVVAMAAGRLFDFTQAGFAVIGTVDTSLPDPVPPGLSIEDAAQLFVSAIGLAFLIFPGGIVLGRSVAARHGYAINPNRELAALGAANLAAAFFRSYAVGASQSRTLLNDANGGKTQMVSLISAALLVAFMALLADWVASLPTVAIAAILTFTGLTLIDLKALRSLGLMRRVDASIALVTSVGVVTIGVLPGILLGVFLSVARLLGQLARPHDAVLARAHEGGGFHDLGDEVQRETIPGLLVYRFYGPLIFANIRYFMERVEAFIQAEPTPVRHVVFDARAVPEIDTTAAEQLRTFIDALAARGIQFAVAKAHLPLRETATQLGLGQWFSERTQYTHVESAVECFQPVRAVP